MFQVLVFNTGSVCVCLQDRTRTFDMHSLENSLIDIMRAENDSLKGKFRHRLFPAANNWGEGFTENKRLQFWVGKVNFPCAPDGFFWVCE